jgi:hypothetical protein
MNIFRESFINEISEVIYLFSHYLTKGIQFLSLDYNDDKKFTKNNTEFGEELMKPFLWASINDFQNINDVISNFESHNTQRGIRSFELDSKIRNISTYSKLDFYRKKCVDLLAKNPYSVCLFLQKFISRAFSNASYLCKCKSIAVESDQTKIGFPEFIQINEAHCLVIVFPKHQTIFPSNNNSTFGFYSNKKCTNVINQFTDVSSMKSFVINANSFYHQMTTQVIFIKLRY